MNIVILAGGLSPERDVSLSSGTRIANALIERGHRVLLLDVYTGLEHLPKDPLSLFGSEPLEDYRIPETPPDLASLRRSAGRGDALIGENVLAVCAAADRVFLALHGGMGENGQLQATLDVHGISYTGSGYLGSCLAMDKEISKRIFESVGVPTPRWMMLDAVTGHPEEVIRRIGLPCVVKPTGCGSSVGIRMADSAAELCEAIAEAARYGTRILIEEKIVGRELTVGILEGEVLPVVEILPEEGFYDYVNKYRGTTREVCPAEIPAEVAARAGELTKRAFAALQLAHYARFDFLMDSAGELWCLEANTLPGMTPTSLLPQAASAAGISYGELCERIARGV